MHTCRSRVAIVFVWYFDIALNIIFNIVFIIWNKSTLSFVFSISQVLIFVLQSILEIVQLKLFIIAMIHNCFVFPFYIQYLLTCVYCCFATIIWNDSWVSVLLFVFHFKVKLLQLETFFLLQFTIIRIRANIKITIIDF